MGFASMYENIVERATIGLSRGKEAKKPKKPKKRRGVEDWPRRKPGALKKRRGVGWKGRLPPHLSELVDRALVAVGGPELLPPPRAVPRGKKKKRKGKKRQK